MASVKNTRGSGGPTKWKAGQSGNPAGRPKGAKDVLQRSVRESILAVYRALGGEEAMTAWGVKNPTEYYRIYARLIPQEHTGAEGGPIAIDVHDHFNSGPPARESLVALPDVRLLMPENASGDE